MSISFRLRPATLFVAGALLVPSAAFAQDVLPIVPSDSTSAPIPAPVAAPPTAPADAQPVLDIAFKDVEVTVLLNMLAEQFDVPVAIAGDVSGRLTISLKGKTPEQALRAIVSAAQLSMVKNEDDIYIVSKTPPASAPVPVVGSPSPLPITPPGTGFGPSFVPSTSSNGVLSPFGTGGRSRNSDPATNMFQPQVDDELTLVSPDRGADAQEKTFQVPIRNVKASLMAFWLDPANHEKPVDLRLSDLANDRYSRHSLITDGVANGQQFGSVPMGNGASSAPFNTMGLVPSAGAANPYLNSNSEMVETRSNAQFQGGGQFQQGGGQFQQGGGRGGRGGQFGGRGGNGNGGVFQLPEGVSRIVAVDPQNALLVFGTPEGAQRLANTIRFLDRPLRQVEIEAQFLSISTSAASNFGLDFTTSRGNFNASATGRATSTLPGGLQLGFFRGNFQAAIAASIASGKAKVLTAPRVTAINNLTANLFQTTRTPIRLNSTTTLSNNGIAQTQNQNLFFIETQIGLQVTPTINNDDTITVLMQPQLTTASAPNSNGDSTYTTQQLETIANVRDGETIALGGLRTTNVTIDRTRVPVLSNLPLLGGLFRSRSSSEAESELIIFLTARIIRRAGDDDGVGTGAADTPIGVGTAIGGGQ